MLNVLVPAWLMPDAGELNTVAPVIFHVSDFTPQLSEGETGLRTIALLQVVVLADMSAGQVITGDIFSTSLTVKVQVRVFLLISFT